MQILWGLFLAFSGLRSLACVLYSQQKVSMSVLQRTFQGDALKAQHNALCALPN
jgi:hypothetical protein